MSTSSTLAENATGTEHRSIDHDRYERACAEDMTVTPIAPGMVTVEHNGERYDVDLVEGACECPDSTYRHVYCKHALQGALAAIYIEGVTTPFVARVARYATDHLCPAGNDGICSGPTGPEFPCPDCVAATTVGEWMVWQQTEGRTGERR